MKPTNIQFHSVQQGSDAWHVLRKSVDFTASEISAALGVSLYKTRDQLMHEKATGIIPDISDFQQKIFDDGHRFEDMARAILEKEIGEDLYPTTITGEVDGLTLLASLDGLTMDGDLAFEHKSPNKKVIAQITSGSIDDHYALQMAQQQVLSGAKICKFVASDGTAENWHEIDFNYENELNFDDVITGLKQFKADLEIYKQKLESGELTQPAKDTVVAEVIQDLPTISYKMNGLALASNLAEYKAKALELVEKSKKPLESDQDFANAESMVKVFKESESKITNMAEQVLGEVSSIDTFVKDLKFIGEQIRQARLATEKQVKSRKDEIRTELVTKAKQEFTALLQEEGRKFNVTYQISVDFAAAIKGKRSIESMESSINDAMAAAKTELTGLVKRVGNNFAVINENDYCEYQFLFNDWQAIAFKASDDFCNLVYSRIDAHKEAEAKRLEAERERIRQEEEAKAQREAEAVAEKERERIRNEERAKAQAEQDSKTKVEAQDKADQEAANQVEQPQNQTATVRIQSRLQQAKAIVNEVQSSPVTELKPKQVETVTISVDEYKYLLHRSEKLDALEAAGVDNWNGYSEAMEMLKAS
jgi:putative phage-type endonuclease